MAFQDAKTRSDWLKSERVNRGHTQRSLARELGVSEGTVRRIESGEALLPPAAKKFADFFGVRVTDLFPVEEAA